MYTPIKLNVFTDQHDMLKNAVTHQKAASIKLNLEDSGGGGGGRHTLLLTRGQIAKIERAKLVGWSIHLSKRHVQANVQHQGGFPLGGLGRKSSSIDTRRTGDGLVSGAVKRAVGGDGLYLVKSGHCGEVEPVKCNGLYLTPHRGGGGGSLLGRVHGDGLYLKRGSTIQEGSGLILGANSPFKNIPILYLLLWTVLL